MKPLLVIRKKTLIIAVIVLCLITVLIGVSLLGSKETFAKTRKLPIYSVDTDKKVLAITFDCAWGVDYTDKLLEIMEKENVKCTFFSVKFWTERYSDYVKKIDEKGHEIGTHSATHPYMSRLNKSAIIKELESSSKAISDITGKRVEVFRPPYGDYNDLLIETSLSLNLYPIQWDVDSLDWKDLSAKEIENRVLSKVQNGSIVLFHNNGLHTSEALPNIIKELKNRGYEFLTVGQLIYRDNYQIDVNGKQKLFL